MLSSLSLLFILSFSSYVRRLVVFRSKMKTNFLAFITFSVAFLIVCCAYKPVIIIHGILDHASDLNDLANFIRSAHPGTNISLISIYEESKSFTPMWKQIKGYQKKVRPIMQQAKDGVHVIGFSQGGIMARGIVETMSDHNVDTLISLSAPQMGQYGDSAYLKPFLPKTAVKDAYKFLYTELFQNLISVANYWNDPYHEDLNLKENVFLPYINNNKSSYFYNKTAYAIQKKNFLKLKKLVLIGGPDDGVITPWQSSQFGCYISNSTNVKTLKEQELYIQDSFGLRSLDNNGGLHTYTFSGVKHIHWHGNKEVFDKAIKPWLT